MSKVNKEIAAVLAERLLQGEALMRRPHHLNDAHVAGFIEAISVDASGRCWVIGWAKTQIGNAMGALVYDGGKHSTALVMARFARDDLPEGASGFIGVLGGEWKPRPATRQIVAVLAVADQPHLRSAGETLRTVDMRALAAIVEAAKGSISGDYAPQLQQMLSAPDSWIPGLGRIANVQIDVGIDNVIAIPGVGCVVEGWMLTPARQVTGFSLRAGDIIRRADPRSTFRMPRADLASAFVQMAETVHDSGFVAFFPVADPEALSQGLTLKIHQGAHISSNHELPDKNILWLNRHAGENALLRCYPAIEHEHFFAAAAAMIKRNYLTPRQRPVGWKPMRAARVLAVVVADHPDEPHRVIDQCLSWVALARERDAGLVLLAPEQVRDRILPLFRDLDTDSATDLGLFLFSGQRSRPGDLVLVLDAIGAERAVIMRDGFRTGTTGIAACLDHLDEVSDDQPPAILQLTGETTQQAVAEGSPALVWTTAALASHVRNAAAWGDLPTDGKVLGQAVRSVLAPPMRPMLMKLKQAGIHL